MNTNNIFIGNTKQYAEWLKDNLSEISSMCDWGELVSTPKIEIYAGDGNEPVFFSHFQKRPAVFAGVVIRKSDHIQPFERRHSNDIGRSHIPIAARRQARMNVQIIR